jgi:hypothetical protein
MQSSSIYQQSWLRIVLFRLQPMPDREGLVAALVEKLGDAGIDPNDIMVFFLETDRASGSFGGGRFAPPVAFA